VPFTRPTQSHEVILGGFFNGNKAWPDIAVIPAAFGQKDILECAKRDEELDRRSIYTRTVVAKIRFRETTTARACFLSVGPEQSMSQRVRPFELSIMICRGYKLQRKAHHQHLDVLYRIRAENDTCFGDTSFSTYGDGK
jgi:hypothetical protein